VVGCWRGYLSGVRCRLAYGPADAAATHCLFASVKSRLVLPFWYRFNWVVLDKGPLNGCVCVCLGHSKNVYDDDDDDVLLVSTAWRLRPAWRGVGASSSTTTKTSVDSSSVRIRPTSSTRTSHHHRRRRLRGLQKILTISSSVLAYRSTSVSPLSRAVNCPFYLVILLSLIRVFVVEFIEQFMLFGLSSTVHSCLFLIRVLVMYIFILRFTFRPIGLAL